MKELPVPPFPLQTFPMVSILNCLCFLYNITQVLILFFLFHVLTISLAKM